MNSHTVVIGDADALIALAHRKDRNHTRAVGVFEKLYRDSLPLLYPATVFADAVTAAERKMADIELAKMLVKLFNEGHIDILPIEQGTLAAAARLWSGTASRQGTFFDAIVLALARETNAAAIFSFDLLLRPLVQKTRLHPGRRAPVVLPRLLTFGIIPYMEGSSTITSKNQITLPAKIVRRAGLKKGHRLSVTLENGRIILTPDQQILDELAGSITLPEKWRGKSEDEIIELAKQEYFHRRGKR